MNLLSQSAFLKGLGWSLMDSVWQLGFLWLMYHLLTIKGNKLTAASRYNLALLSLLGGISLFLLGIVYRVISGNTSSSLFSDVILLNYDLSTPLTENIVSYISGAYILIALLLISKLFYQYRFTRRLTSEGLLKADPDLRVFVQERSGQMGIKRKVEVWLSSMVDAPMTIGFFKPVILLPVAVVNQLSIHQAQAILLHELEHIRRNDYLVNLVIAFSSALLFFNPFAKSLISILKKERENSCDDRVLYYDYSITEYASALLLLEKQRNQHHHTALKAIGNNRNFLLNRVKRIVNGDLQRTPIDLGLVSLFGLFLTIALVGWYKKEVSIKGPDAMLPFVFAALEPTIDEEDPIQPSEKPSYKADFLTGSKNSFEYNAPLDATSNHEIVHENVKEPTGETLEMMFDYVEDKIVRDYSINEKQEITNLNEPLDAIGPGAPYIPSSSLDFQLMEDTTITRFKVATVHEKLAKEALQKAILELEKICKENEGLEKLAEIDLKKLREELKATNATSMNWQEIESEIREANAQIRNNVRVKEELEKFNKNRIMHQEKVNKLKEQILLERLGSKEKKIVEL